MNKKLNIAQILKPEYIQWLVVLCCNLVLVGFVCSRALASIGMIGIIVVSILGNGIVETLKEYFKNKTQLALSLFFWIVFISGLYSDDKHDWINWVRIKLPYLFLPIAFAALKKLDAQKFTVFLYGFILTFFISTVLVLGNYVLHYQAITDGFSRGNAVPMPFSHIRYTLMLAFSFFCGLYLLDKKQYLFSANEKYLQFAITLFAFIALHVLAVRSALLALYLGMIFLAIRAIFYKREILLGTALLVIIAALPFVAYRYIPGLNNKISYMKYDLGKYNEGQVNDYSDGMRILSMKIGLDIWKEHPVIGVGPGDLKTETYKIYAAQYPQIGDDSRRLPHNEFIWVLDTVGAVGFALFMFAFIFPLAYKGYYKQWLVVVLHVLLFSSFFTEHTLEEQVGTGFYLIFLLIFLNHFSPDE